MRGRRLNRGGGVRWCGKGELVRGRGGVGLARILDCIQDLDFRTGRKRLFQNNDFINYISRAKHGKSGRETINFFLSSDAATNKTKTQMDSCMFLKR